MIKVPKSIQVSIRRMFYHNQVVKNNAKKVDDWMLKNKIDKTIPLQDLLDNLDYKKPNKYIAKGQMSIFDYI